MNLAIRRCDWCKAMARPDDPVAVLKWAKGSRTAPKRDGEICTKCEASLAQWLDEGGGIRKANARLIALKPAEFDR
jgi:hypothetical protein